jgi:carbonic anhydrase
MSKLNQILFFSLFLGMCDAKTPDQVINDLKKGNKSFKKNAAHSKRRTELVSSQKPIAIIVGCSDSRTTPSKIFNQTNLGTLFEIRNAGNIASDCSAIGSIEYAVAVLKSPLIVVLGHQNCGAVDAALKSTGQSSDLPECIQTIINNINKNPDLARLKQEGDKNKLLEEATKSNICQTANNIRTQSRVIDGEIKKGKVKIVGAYYNFNGEVEWLEC